MEQLTEDLMRFWSELARLLEDGRPMLAALEAAGRQCSSPEASSAVQTVVDAVASGTSLPDALAANPDCFGLGAIHVMRGGDCFGMPARAARFVADAAADCPTCAAWCGDTAG